MKRKKIFLGSIAALCLFASLFAKGQISVYHIDPSSAPISQQGIFYSLPRTVVNIEVVIDRIERYKGPYSEYALRYLGLQNVVMANSVEYRISGINITTSAEPDPGQYYFVVLGEKLSKTEKAGLLSLNESGLILGTLPDAMDSTVQIIRIQEGKNEVTLSEMDVFPEIFKYYADISVFEKVDTIIRKVSIDTLTLERQYLKRTMVDKSPEQKAKEAADFISKIKENRFNLLTGYQEVSYNQATLEYMDTQLKLLEKEYMKLFTGISIQKSYTYDYKYIPLANQINVDIPMFKFLPNKGVMDLDEMGGRAITINIQRVGNTTQVANYLNRASEEEKNHGFYYRIPEIARVTVKQPNGMVGETQCLVNQLGVVTFLPASKWKVNFHEKTGGIKEVAID
ncbi:MAG: DUF4831 family protein [Bacteroidales bacterium]|nr:DUF4831 family protein [Bacteroidales bacterium]